MSADLRRFRFVPAKSADQQHGFIFCTSQSYQNTIVALKLHSHSLLKLKKKFDLLTMPETPIFIIIFKIVQMLTIRCTFLSICPAVHIILRAGRKNSRIDAFLKFKLLNNKLPADQRDLLPLKLFNNNMFLRLKCSQCTRKENRSL